LRYPAHKQTKKQTHRTENNCLPPSVVEATKRKTGDETAILGNERDFQCDLIFNWKPTPKYRNNNF